LTAAMLEQVEQEEAAPKQADPCILIKKCSRKHK